jgi:isopenicillin N synthase-like dioxygenase
MKRQVPTLNLKDFRSNDNEVRDQFINNLRVGLIEYGFIILEGHFVKQEEIDLAYEKFKAFFNLPIETKLKYAKEEYKKQRGYIPFGLEQAVGFEHPDLKEFWHVGRELSSGHKFEQYYPNNISPDEIKQFDAITRDIYKKMDKTSNLLLEAISIGLELEPNYLREMAKDGNSILRCIHYPPTKGEDTRNRVRAAAHGDINLITLLVGATDSGLELLDNDGSWLAVDSKPGQIVVDTGDMMSRITNDVLPATIHRVVNPDNDSSARFSMPFFVHPHPEATLECLPSCIGDGAKYPPVNAQEFLFQRLEKIGLKPR